MTDEERDAALIHRVADGDSAALGQVYDHFGTSVYSLSLRLVGDRESAEELVQETFVRAWRQAGSYEPARGSVRVWLLRIARNVGIDELRRRTARPQAVVADDYLATLESGTDDPSEQVYQHIQHETVTAALNRLPEQQRQVLQLAYYGGMSGSEIAAHTGDALGTVKTRMRLGLQKLKGDLSIQEGRVGDETGAAR